MSIDYIGDDRTLNQMLLVGELDAVIGARLPRALGRDPRIQRLFPNYRQVEQEYFRKTGIFPIMHTMVMREELYRQKPWIAESLYKGFEASSRLGWEAMHDDGNTRLMLPWLAQDVEELEALCGGNPWRSGVPANRTFSRRLPGICTGNASSLPRSTSRASSSPSSPSANRPNRKCT